MLSVQTTRKNSEVCIIIFCPSSKGLLKLPSKKTMFENIAIPSPVFVQCLLEVQRLSKLFDIAYVAVKDEIESMTY